MEETHTSHPLSQEKVKPRPQTSAIKSFKCCKEGEMLLSSDETANCSSCGLFFIFNVSAWQSSYDFRKMGPSAEL
jgi:hypothetical protein